MNMYFINFCNIFLCNCKMNIFWFNIIKFSFYSIVFSFCYKLFINLFFRISTFINKPIRLSWFKTWNFFFNTNWLNISICALFFYFNVCINNSFIIICMVSC